MVGYAKTTLKHVTNVEVKNKIVNLFYSQGFFI